MRWMLSAALAMGLVHGARAQNPPDEREDSAQRARLGQAIERLVGGLRGLGDWQKQHDLIVDSLGRVYERNGWTSESDQFSLTMIDEVNEIPPWRPEERLNRAVEMLGDRYMLDADQSERLKSTILREATGLFTRNAGRIAQYAGQAIQARVAGEPFTPEQVAQWVQLAEPVFRDARERMRTGAQEFMGTLNPQQRAMAQTDFDALNKRLDRVEQMNQKWVRGEWQATDWGMEDDPIQKAGDAHGAEQDDGARGTGAGGTSGRRSNSPAAGATPAPTAARSSAPAAANDSDPWSDYVRRFIHKYRLDETQQARAWRIGHDVSGWAEKADRQHTERVAAAARRPATATAPGASVADLERQHAAAVKQLWDQLVRRLERLPTRAQRKNADASPLPVPGSAAAEPPKRPIQDGP